MNGRSAEPDLELCFLTGKIEKRENTASHSKGKALPPDGRKQAPASRKRSYLAASHFTSYL